MGHPQPHSGPTGPGLHDHASYPAILSGALKKIDVLLNGSFERSSGMNKPLLGLILGGILGVFDGLTSWFTPEVRAQLVGIVIGSTVKGLVAGLLIGFFSRKVNNVVWRTLFGLAVCAFFAFLIAYMQGKYYFEIMLPGSILGLVVGLATQKFPKPTPA